MAYRIPRGYDVNRPPYQEISEGVRPEASAIPMEAWSGLAPVRIDQLSHDPIVLDAGTIVGIASGGLAEGKLFPAHQSTGDGVIHMLHHSDGASWGLPTSTKPYDCQELTDGPVLPLGVVFQPIYSFMLQLIYTNYKRNENVGIVTDYMIQIPARTPLEKLIQPGEIVMCADDDSGYSSGAGHFDYGQVVAGRNFIGSYQKWDEVVDKIPFIIGRCYRRLVFATTTAGANTVLDVDVDNITLSNLGNDEFKDLGRVQTVPGLGLGGSGTGGVPSWLMKAQADASNQYHALTILVRL